MSDLVKRLMERRANTWENAKEIIDRATDENRTETAEERSAFEAANAELDALDARIKSILEGEERAKASAEAFERIEAKPAVRSIPGAEDPHSEVRALLRGETRSMSTEGHYLNFGAPSVEARVGLVKGTNSAGGYTVPTNFYDQLVQHLVVNSAIIKAGATVLNTDGGANYQIAKTTGHPAATLVSEAATISESDPTFAQVTLGAYKFADLILVSNELINDTAIDLTGYLAQRLAVSVANGFGQYAITGTGSSQPAGLVTGATLGVTGGTGVTGAFTADNLIDLFYSVNPAYRASTAAGWLMADATLGAVRKLKDSQGRYLWEPNYQVGAPDTILGKPVNTDPNVATTAISAKSVVFGDISKYFIRIAGGIDVQSSTEFAFNSDQTAMRVTFRADGVLVDQTGAVKYFQGAAS